MRNQRIEKLQNIAKSQKIRTIYINNVGAFDNEIFDGGSLIINKNGEVIKELNLFSEEIYLSSNQEDIINKDKNYAEGEEPALVGKFFNRFETATNRIVNFVEAKKEVDKDAEATMTEAERLREQDSKRQAENAKIAIHEGGIFGKGPGKSTQRYSLSMAFSDFIYAFIVEEYGLVGGIFVILIYLIFLFRCITIANRCETIFPAALVLGLAFLIATQAFLHILVNVGLMPVTGHTLPLISHGGTAYMVLSGAFGILLSISKQLDKQDEIKHKELEEEAKQKEDEIMYSENYLL